MLMRAASPIASSCVLGCMLILVGCPQLPTVDFSGQPTVGTAPLTVQFTDQSTAAVGISGWRWAFGDGSISLIRNPSHTYVLGGDYSVTLLITTSDGQQATLTRTDYVSVQDGGEGEGEGEGEGDGTMVVFGYNDLGMHCMNQSFAELMILPPYNNLHALVIDRRDEDPEILKGDVTITYEVPSNTTSADKTDFWDYALDLFSVALPPDIGLTGKGLSGTMASQEASGRNDWMAAGIPITPINDLGQEDPYPLAVIRVYEGATLKASTRAVVPVSWEISCNLCHKGPRITTDTDILRKHDDMHDTELEGHKPVACGQCHAQEALGFPGASELPSLSRAIHDSHASRMYVLSLANTCYACHPGIRTECLRGVHYSKGLTCADCHGKMKDVADAARRPWIDEPRCGDCHTRQGFEFEPRGTLYRNAKGHQGVHCAACHGSPHAITPSVIAADNLQANQLQGHPGVINTCSVCHSEEPDEPFEHRSEDEEDDDKGRT